MADRATALYIPELEQPYINEHSTTKTVLFRSGLVVANANLDSQLNGAAGAANVYHTPFNLSIEDTQITAVGTHDVDDKLAKKVLSSGSYQTKSTARAESFGLSNITQIISGANGAGVLSEQIGSMWANHYQTVALEQIKGLVADNVANNASDMVVNKYSDIASPLAANLISADAVIDARHTMGDSRSALNVIVLHSKVRKQLEKDEPNNFIPASATDIGFDTYLGMVILEDDGMTVAAGSNSDEYTTILLGSGVFQYASFNGWRQLEWDRDITSGNGMGEDFLVTRSRFILHPQGFSFDVAGQNPADFPTDAQYATAANWSRTVASRKQIKLAVLKTNAL